MSMQKYGVALDFRVQNYGLFPIWSFSLVLLFFACVQNRPSLFRFVQILFDLFKSRFLSLNDASLNLTRYLLKSKTTCFTIKGGILYDRLDVIYEGKTTCFTFKDACAPFAQRLFRASKARQKKGDLKLFNITHVTHNI